MQGVRVRADTVQAEIMLLTILAVSFSLSAVAAARHALCRVCACLQTQHKEELDIRDNRGRQAGAGGYGGPGQAPAVQMIPTGAQNPNFVVLQQVG
jgi:hypothetical protein